MAEHPHLGRMFSFRRSPETFAPGKARNRSQPCPSVYSFRPQTLSSLVSRAYFSWRCCLKAYRNGVRTPQSAVSPFGEVAVRSILVLAFVTFVGPSFAQAQDAATVQSGDAQPRDSAGSPAAGAP